MRSYLTDPSVSDPSMRLQRLIDRCVHDGEVERQNRALRQTMAADRRDDDDEPADPEILTDKTIPA